jgi:S1-C subfamily serine protease
VGGVTGAVRRRKGRTNSASLLGASLGLCLSGSAAGAPQANALKPTPALPAAPLNAPTPAPTPTGTPDSTLATLVGPTSARTAEPGSCDPGWATRVYAETRASVVRIENAEGLGTGFIAFTPKYVATAFHVVALGRPLTVTAADGSTQAARVVAIDRAHDLALVELDHPIQGVTPLETETLPAPVGTPVLVIGHPFAFLDRVNRRFDGLLYWSATQGIISAHSDEFLQIDAAVNPGNSGGPLLTCDGRVLGLVTAKLGGEAIGFAVPMARMNALFRQIGKQRLYAGRLSAEGLLGVEGQLDPSYRWLGVGLGFGVIIHDRWTTELRGGLLWATSTPDSPPTVLSSTGFRILGELDETYRFLLFERPFPGYLLAGAGVAGTIDRLSQTTLGEAPVTPGCKPLDSLACNQIIGVQTHQTNKRLWPMVTAGFLLAGSLELTYAFEVNVGSLADSEHRLLLAIPF